MSIENQYLNKVEDPALHKVEDPELQSVVGEDEKVEENVDPSLLFINENGTTTFESKKEHLDRMYQEKEEQK